MKTNYLLLLLTITGCSVTLYSENEIVRPPSASHRVLIPAPEGLQDYSDATAKAWDRTFNECIQIREWMSHEIAQRRSIAARKRWFFTLLSAAAAVASVTYSALEANPSGDVLVPLGLASGAAVFTLQQATTKDERLDWLEALITRMDNSQRRALDAMQTLERRYISEADITSQEKEELVGTLQQRLTDWQLLCQ